MLWTASAADALREVEHKLTLDFYEFIAADQILDLMQVSWDDPQGDEEFASLAGSALISGQIEYGSFRYW